MTNKNIDKAKGRVKKAAGALTADRHLKNKGRVDQAKGSAKNAVDKVGDTLTARNKKTKHARACNPTHPNTRKVTMLTILIILLLVVSPVSPVLMVVDHAPRTLPV